MTYSERLYIMESKQKAKEREEQEKQVEKLREIKKIEDKKDREKEKKQYEKDMFIACYHDLRNSFDRVFEKANPKSELELNVLLAQFYNVEIRKDYAKTLGETLVQQDYIDKIYDKTLNEIYKKWKNNLKYVEFQQIKEEAEKQEEMNKSITLKILLGFAFAGFLIWAFIKFALFAGIILAIIIFLAILGCAMKQ